jgi:hypothetical protein
MTTEDQNTFRIELGALCPPIFQQLSGQGLEMETVYLDHAEADATAITRLLIRGFLTDSEARKARKRLVKFIVKNVRRSA